jgi:hypothetical protein
LSFIVISSNSNFIDANVSVHSNATATIYDNNINER